MFDSSTSAIATHLRSFYEKGVDARPAYYRESVLLLPAVPLFYSAETFDKISEACATQLSYHRIDSGDTNDRHDLNCSRLVGSPAGRSPGFLSEHAESILQQVANPALMSYLQGILGIGDQPLHFRRAQSHQMREGQFIGPHVDNHADPDWDCVIILYLRADFHGGEHVMDYRDGRPIRDLPIAAGDIFIGPVDVWHWVKPVTAGCRRSLIGFLSRYNGPNRRTDMNPPRYQELDQGNGVDLRCG